MTFIVNRSNISLPDSESGKLLKLLLWSILIGWWKLQRSSAHDLLWAVLRFAYDSIMKSCILIRLLLYICIHKINCSGKFNNVDLHKTTSFSEWFYL